MGFFSKLFKKIEKVNKGEETSDNLKDIFALQRISKDEANAKWVAIAQGLLVNSAKATANTIERAFVLVDFDVTHPSFNIFYQVDGKLVYWNQLENDEYKNQIATQLLPQAKETVEYIHGIFEEANLEKIRFAELQLEMATFAWFSHIIYKSEMEQEISTEELLNKWFQSIDKVYKDVPLDSDSRFPWYPEKEK